MKILVKIIVFASVVLILFPSCLSGPGIFGNNKFVGNIWPDSVGESVQYAEFWKQLTPSNDSKWGSVEGVRDDMYWDSLDEAYAYSRERGIPFRFHTLVWGQQQPSWIKDLSPDEQLEEVEEWFTLAGERYPDVEFIDVVNEPLHQPPPYMEALGGKGETGYDWIITAFRMAREHFPNSQLHINDFHIVRSPTNAKEYNKIIELLKAEDLIDGVGMQAHFLEETKPLTVRGCIEILSETELPLYITEFDLDIANDVLHARKFKELFTIFYEDPRIAGITLWGAAENKMWRENGYLITKEGEFRIAMEWLDSYLNGSGTYEIPEYRDQPRRGEKGVNRIQADSFNDQNGVQAFRDVLSYTDKGDWVKYSAVDFRLEYTAFKIRYSKGGKGDEGSVSVVMGKRDGYEVMTLDLPHTGGWDEYKEIQVDWPQTVGQYDLYLVFNGGRNIANIDYFEFLKPGSNPLLDFASEDVAEEEGGLTLEGEEAREIEGIRIMEGALAYIDEGDYIRFDSVDFSQGEGFSRLLVKYAKNSETFSGIELRLDSLDSEVLTSFRLQPTGGWSEYEYVLADLPEISGVHDLYITFRLTDTSGVGNFDWFRFLP